MDAESPGVEEVVSLLEQMCEGTGSLCGLWHSGEGMGQDLSQSPFPCAESLWMLWLSGSWGFPLIHSQSKARENPKASPTFPMQQSLCPEQTQRKIYLVLEMCISFHANYISNYIFFHPSPARMAMGILMQAHSIILIYFFSFSDF